MSGNSIVSSGGYITRTTSPISPSGDITMLTAFKLTGSAPSAGGFIGIAGIEGTDAQAIFFLAGSAYTVPNSLVSYYFTGTNTVVKAQVSSLASLAGKWVHLAYTRNGTTGAQNVYAAFESSPSTFLINPNVGSYNGGVGYGTTYELLSDADGDNGNGITQGRSILAQVELNSTQIAAQFAQRAAISAITAVSYSFSGFQDATHPEIDLGNTASNFTKITTAGGFADSADQPSDWVSFSGAAIPTYSSYITV